MTPLLPLLIMGVVSLLFGCSRSNVIEGGLYCTPGEKGGYHVLKSSRSIKAAFTYADFPAQDAPVISPSAIVPLSRL